MPRSSPVLDRIVLVGVAGDTQPTDIAQGSPRTIGGSDYQFYRRWAQRFDSNAERVVNTTLQRIMNTVQRTYTIRYDSVLAYLDTRNLVVADAEDLDTILYVINMYELHTFATTGRKRYLRLEVEKTT